MMIQQQLPPPQLFVPQHITILHLLYRQRSIDRAPDSLRCSVEPLSPFLRYPMLDGRVLTQEP